MATINKIHDKFYRETMSDLRVAKDFFSVHLPEKIKQKIDLDTLQVEKTDFITQPNFVTGEQESKVVDMLYSVKIKGKTKIDDKTGYFHILAEHQSTACREMPLRLMRYMLEIIDYDIKKQKENGVQASDIEYPIIVPLILYNGRSAYNYSTNFFDMYADEYKDLAHEIITNPFQLIDLNNIQDDQLRGHVWASILEFAMQANTNKFRNDVDAILKKLTVELIKIESERDGDALIESVICYTLGVADIRNNNPRKCLETIAKEFSEQNRSKIMSAADRLEKIGEDRGIEKGVEQGVVKTALNMIKEKIDIETISKVTELPIEELKKLQAKNQGDF